MVVGSLVMGKRTRLTNKAQAHQLYTPPHFNCFLPRAKWQIRYSSIIVVCAERFSNPQFPSSVFTSVLKVSMEVKTITWLQVKAFHKCRCGYKPLKNVSLYRHDESPSRSWFSPYSHIIHSVYNTHGIRTENSLVCRHTACGLVCFVRLSLLFEQSVFLNICYIIN